MPHHWIDRIGHAIPDLNSRVLNLDDLYQYCDSQNYFAIERQLQRLHGCSFLGSDGQPSMVINSLLRESEKIVAGWHEYIHLLIHSPKDNVFCSTGNLWRHGKTEQQAQTIGVIALLPCKMLSEDLSDYPAKIVKYRMQIWQNFKI